MNVNFFNFFKPINPPSEEAKNRWDDCCAVCLGSSKKQQLTQINNCKHIFHESCLSDWFKEHKNCPLCRGKTIHPIEEYVRESAKKITSAAKIAAKIALAAGVLIGPPIIGGALGSYFTRTLGALRGGAIVGMGSVITTAIRQPQYVLHIKKPFTMNGCSAAMIGAITVATRAGMTMSVVLAGIGSFLEMGTLIAHENKGEINNIDSVLGNIVGTSLVHGSIAVLTGGVMAGVGVGTGISAISAGVGVIAGSILGAAVSESALLVARKIIYG